MNSIEQNPESADVVNYSCAKGKCNLEINTQVIAKFIDPQTRALKRQDFARHVFHTTYDSLFHPERGRLLALKSLTITSIGTSSTELDKIKLSCEYEAYFYKPYQKGVADVLVKNINSKSIMADLLGYSVEINNTDVFPGLSPEYDSGSKSLKYPNQKEIGQDSLLRVRITNICPRPGVSQSWDQPPVTLRASCIYPGCGKRE